MAQDPQALSRALQGVISPAITEGIANNKEKMIDALYPIMGGMISKYVTQAIKEMMETINQKIEQGFSVERYKRKLKAKLTGVSESELLLEESADAHVDAMFIIHKETGLLISEAHLEESRIGDPHMVASMASAIRDFINDWIADNAQIADEIQILSYGNATLYIESAGSVYLIAFLDSEPDYEQRTQINHFFGSLIKKYATFFQTFDGDESAPEVTALSDEMQAYLQAHMSQKAETPTTTAKKNPAKYLFWGVGIVLIAYAGYGLKSFYDQRTMLSQIVEKTGEHLQIEERNGKDVISGLLQDQAHIETIRKIVRYYYPKDEVQLDLGLSIEAAENMQSQAQQKYRKMLEAQQHTIATLEDSVEKALRISDERLEKIEKTLEKNSRERMVRQEIAKLTGIKKEIGKALENALGDVPYYDRKKRVLNFSSLHLFEAGKTEPNGEKMQVVISLFERYLTALEPYMPYIKYVTVRSYSDSSGSNEENLRLTTARAQKVKAYLLQIPEVRHDLLGKHLKAVGEGERAPVLIDGVEDPEASRRIEIGFVVDKKKIEKKLKHCSEEYRSEYL